MRHLYIVLFHLLHHFCHQIPERSFHWNGVQWPLCARCSGSVLGGLIALALSIWEGKHRSQSHPQIKNFFLMTPLIVDGLLRLTDHLSLANGNLMRFATGVLFSLGSIDLFQRCTPMFEQYLNTLSARFSGMRFLRPILR